MNALRPSRPPWRSPWLLCLLLIAVACGQAAGENRAAAEGSISEAPSNQAASQPQSASKSSTSAATATGLKVATFAGGCFWCMEGPYDDLDGVASTTSGYTGGHVTDPSYEQVSSGRTGHAESVEVLYDPKVVSYEKLLDVYWHNIDPLTKNRQFCDAGTQYRTAIFVHDAEQRRLAEASKEAIAKRFDQPIVTEIVDAGPFYPAEDYHQDFYEKNPLRYKFYRTGCGRDRRLKQLWGDEAGH